MFVEGMKSVNQVLKVPGKCLDCGEAFEMKEDFVRVRDEDNFVEEVCGEETAVDVCWICREF